jgi:hypothetical protein
VVAAVLAAPPAISGSPPASTCSDPLARAAGARFCIHHAAGYTRFQNAMTAPNKVFWIQSKQDQEVIVFDNWVVVSSEHEHTLVPRERLVYSAENEFE